MSVSGTGAIPSSHMLIVKRVKVQILSMRPVFYQCFQYPRGVS